MTEWSEWMYTGCPSVGDYVQVEARGLESPYMDFVYERTVVRVVNKIVTLFPDTENSVIHWAIRWRRRLFSDLDCKTMETERELETV